MPSLRAQYLENIRKAVEGISGVKVLPHDVDQNMLEGASTVVGVFPSQILGLLVGASHIKVSQVNEHPFTFDVAIRAVLRTSIGKAEADKESLIEELLKAIWADRRRGDKVNPVDTTQFTVSEEFVAPDGSSALAGFLATVRVEWLGNPKTP